MSIINKKISFAFDCSAYEICSLLECGIVQVATSCKRWHLSTKLHGFTPQKTMITMKILLKKHEVCVIVIIN